MQIAIRSLALLALVAAPAFGQVGKPLPAAELEDFTQTEATTLTDYTGRAVLIEFFAYW